MGCSQQGCCYCWAAWQCINRWGAGSSGLRVSRQWVGYQEVRGRVRVLLGNFGVAFFCIAWFVSEIDWDKRCMGRVGLVWDVEVWSFKVWVGELEIF